MSNNLTLWTRRDPFADFDTVIRNAFGPAAPTTAAQRGFTPAAEVVRDGDDAVVRLELPGVDVAKDVSVELDKGRLVVHGERRDERSEDRTGRRQEFRYGSFRRSFSLPAHVTAEAITAEYDAGVLSVRVSGVYLGTEPKRIIIGGTTESTTEQ